jgi:pilus assembly protein Flp/PilA
MARFAKLIRDEKAASAVEYGLIVALIVIAMMAGLTQFAGTTIKMWNDIAANVAASG